MSGVVLIEIRETEEELKAHLTKEKDATCHERKTASPVSVQNQNGRNCIICCCAVRETSYHNTKMVV
ncbi:hypothetical protein QT982_04960 [Microcoleus sp. herbarium2]